MLTEKESQYYSEKNKRCETCMWHCVNPLYKSNKANSHPWICGCEDDKTHYRKRKTAEDGRRCKHWKCKKDPEKWAHKQCKGIKSIKLHRGKLPGWYNLYFHANDIVKYYKDSEKIGSPQHYSDYGNNALEWTASRFGITVDDVKECIDYIGG